MPKGTSNPAEASPLGCLERRVPVDGLNVRFWTAGKGPALVLVHGLLGYSFSWRHAIRLLSDRYQVFAPDMPGAGFSDFVENLNCRLSAATGRLLGFLDAVGISDCDLAGSSYGGATALLAAAQAPSRIRRLILISPANPWSRNGRTRLQLLRNPAIAWLFPKLARLARPLHAYFVRRMYGDPSRITEETLEGYARPLIEPGRFEHAVRIVRSWNRDMRELESALEKIRDMPTLIVWGSEDRVVDPASAAVLSRHLKNLRIAIMNGAGHLPYEECPEEFCRIVADFLTQRSTVDLGPTREVT